MPPTGLRDGFTRSLVARVEAAFADAAEMALQNRILASDASEEVRQRLRDTAHEQPTPCATPPPSDDTAPLRCCAASRPQADDLALQWLFCLFHRDASAAEAAGAALGDDPSAAATPFARALLHLLRELLRAGGRDRTVTRLAVDGPHLPEAAVALLAQLCGVADEREAAVLAEADKCALLWSDLICPLLCPAEPVAGAGGCALASALTTGHVVRVWCLP